MERVKNVCPFSLFVERLRLARWPSRRFDLTKNGPHLAEFVMTPMLQETLSVGCDSPIVGIREIASLIDVEAELIDNG